MKAMRSQPHRGVILVASHSMAGYQCLMPTASAVQLREQKPGVILLNNHKRIFRINQQRIFFVSLPCNSTPTVYLSTHCPEGYENLELKRVIKL